MAGIVVNSILQLSPLPLSPNPVPHRPSPLPQKIGWLVIKKKDAHHIQSKPSGFFIHSTKL